MPNISLDRIDQKILYELQQNARLPLVELAKRINLSKTPCSERVKRLEQAGVIIGYHAELAPEQVGAAHIVFVQVLLSSTKAADLERFNQEVGSIPEIQSCHMIAGSFDYLLKVRTRDIAHYRQVMGEQISALHAVQQTHTYVVMESIKDETTLSTEAIKAAYKATG